MIRTLLTLFPDNARRRVVAHLLLTVLSVALRAAGAVVLIPLLTALFGPIPVGAWPWVGALAALTVLGWVVDAVIVEIGFSLGFVLLDNGQHALADRIAQTKLTWFSAENTSTARQAMAATGPDLVGILIYLVTPILTAVLLPAAIAIALIPLSWPLGLAALAGVPVLLGAYLLAGRLSRKADHAADAAGAQLTERILEFARTQHALRAARRVDPARSQTGDALRTQHSAVMRLLLMQVPGQLLFSLASQLALVLFAGAGVAIALHGGLSAPAAVGLIVVVVRYLEPFTVLAELSGGVESSAAALRRIRAVMTAPSTATGTDSPRSSGPPRVELRGVSFGYDGEQPVLRDLDLVLESGETTAIVGPSGSGKSTVLALIAGLHLPSAGDVLVAGTSTRAMTEESRQATSSMIFQEPYLFAGTVAENIRAADPDASEESVQRAGRLARVDTITERLPESWQSQVGEGGKTLSGGERQRVSIARALLKPAPVLLVDEATSALDTENEAAITAALVEDDVPRTRVIVAHRLASIRAADRVVFLEEGRVVEEGPIAALLEKNGRFAEFWRQHDAAESWHLGESPEL